MWLTRTFLALGIILVPSISIAQASSSDKCLDVVVNSEDIIQAYLDDIPKAKLYEYALSISDETASNGVIALTNTVYAGPKEADAAREHLYQSCMVTAKEEEMETLLAPFKSSPEVQSDKAIQSLQEDTMRLEAQSAIRTSKVSESSTLAHHNEVAKSSTHEKTQVNATRINFPTQIRENDFLTAPNLSAAIDALIILLSALLLIGLLIKYLFIPNKKNHS